MRTRLIPAAVKQVIAGAIAMTFLTSPGPALAKGQLLACRDTFDKGESAVPLETLFQAAQMVHTNPMSLALLSSDTQERLRNLANGSTSYEDLRTFDAALENLRSLMGLPRFEQALGMSLQAAKKSGQALDRKRDRDKRDLHRVWGWKLLPSEDPIFYDPTYLANLMKLSGASGSGTYFYSHSVDPIESFEKELRALAPQLKVLRYTNTGTDANNVAYEIAKENRNLNSLSHNYDRRTAVTEADVLVMSRSYMGVHGRSGEFLLAKAQTATGKASPYDQGSELIIESPLSVELDPTDKEEIKRLTALEKKALTAIRAQATNQPNNIGALIIEPIIGAEGVLFYRTKFMRQLRALCDELKIPLVADEILTGGGRTGKFFAYQHYRGFEPDFVTFGEGLQVSGIAEVIRRGHSRWQRPFKNPPHRFSTTTAASPEGLLKGAYIMKRIREGKLMENVAKTGEYFVQRLRESYHALPKYGRDGTSSREASMRNDYPRGMGFLIWAPRTSLKEMPAMGRLLPPLTLTESDVDELLSSQ